MIAVAAGEAKDPERAVKKAFKSTAIRLILFYLLSLFLIVALVPWTTLIGADATSPFVMVMKIVGIPYADSILNFIVIVAALSAMNSMLYISTRMLFSLSRAGMRQNYLVVLVTMAYQLMRCYCQLLVLVLLVLYIPLIRARHSRS